MNEIKFIVLFVSYIVLKFYEIKFELFLWLGG